MRADMVRAYVESLLERLTGTEKSVPDEDGDYPVRYRDALYFIRLVGDVDPIIQVFSIAVDGVAKSAKLLERLNQINTEVRFTRVFWVRGQVLVEADLMGENIDPESFRTACSTVASVTDSIAPGIAERFGGRLAFAEEKVSPAPGSSDPGPGGYL